MLGLPQDWPSPSTENATVVPPRRIRATMVYDLPHFVLVQRKIA
jgi:hypothetical protein